MKRARPSLPQALTLRAPGLELRDWTDAEAPALRSVCGDPDVCRFTSVPWAYSPPAARAWVERQWQLRRASEGVVLG